MEGLPADFAGFEGIKCAMLLGSNDLSLLHNDWSQTVPALADLLNFSLFQGRIKSSSFGLMERHFGGT